MAKKKRFEECGLGCTGCRAGRSGPGSAVRGEFGDEDVENIRQKHMGGLGVVASI